MFGLADGESETDAQAQSTGVQPVDAGPANARVVNGGASNTQTTITGLSNIKPTNAESAKNARGPATSSSPGTHSHSGFELQDASGGDMSGTGFDSFPRAITRVDSRSNIVEFNNIDSDIDEPEGGK